MSLNSTAFRDNIGDEADEEEEAQPPLQKLVLQELIAYLAGLA